MTLSIYYWQIKQPGRQGATIKWRILSPEHAFSRNGNKCNLCIAEKLSTLWSMGDGKLLNRRQELMCVHRNKNKHLIRKFLVWDKLKTFIHLLYFLHTIHLGLQSSTPYMVVIYSWRKQSFPPPSTCSSCVGHIVLI